MADLQLQNVLSQGLAEQGLTPEQWQALIAWELADLERAAAWGIASSNVEDRLQQRWDWLLQMAPCHGDSPLGSIPLDNCLELYWGLWLPLALHLKQLREQRASALIQGIFGGARYGQNNPNSGLAPPAGGHGVECRLFVYR